MFAKRRLVPYEFKVAPVELSSKEMVCSEFREASPVDQFLPVQKKNIGKGYSWSAVSPYL
jgi:hypothetical protein